MAYFREISLHRKNCLAGFTPDQRAGLDKVSARDKGAITGGPCARCC